MKVEKPVLKIRNKWIIFELQEMIWNMSG